MYTHTPENNKKIGLATVAICFMSTMLLFMPSKLDPSISTLLRCLGLWLFLCGFLVLERYVLTVFTYTVKDCPECVELVITETRLKKQKTVCRVTSDNFVSLTEKGKAKRQKGTKRYNYCPELCGSKRHILCVEDGDGRSDIIFRPDSKIIEIIDSFIV